MNIIVIIIDFILLGVIVFGFLLCFKKGFRLWEERFIIYTILFCVIKTITDIMYKILTEMR